MEHLLFINVKHVAHKGCIERFATYECSCITSHGLWERKLVKCAGQILFKKNKISK